MMSKMGKEVVTLFVVALSLFLCDLPNNWLIIAVCAALYYLKIEDEPFAR